MKTLQATFILSGMIIGVGMFGIPFSFARVGFWLGALELVVLAGVIAYLHWIYAEVVLKTPAYHRLPGYARIHLGNKFAILAWASAFFGISGTLLAYVIVGSRFLHTLTERFWDGSTILIWALAVVAAGALITAFPLRREALINGILTGLLILFTAGLGIWLLPGIKIANLSGLNFENVAVPYGVLLFALSGGVVIPDLITYLGKDRRRVRAAVVGGTLIPAVLYFLFALAVVGVSGAYVSEEAITGLGPVAGGGAVFIGALIGFLAVFTSYLVLLTSFQALLRIDFKLPSAAAWIVSSAIPMALYFLGFQNFILVIAAVGALAVGVDSALILAMRGKVSLGRAAIYGMIMLGVIYELYSLFF